MLSGLPPFVDYDDNAINTPFWIYVNQMKENPDKKLDFPHAYWKDISDQARNFCTCCLQVDPKKRSRSTDLLSHPWFKTQAARTLHTVEHRKKYMTMSISSFDFGKAQEYYSAGDEDAFFRMVASFTRSHSTVGTVKAPVGKKGVGTFDRSYSTAKFH
eukprot:TRINITY_DN14089_c0_g1_i1.p1 TRINITY_DN14089_c0_g1~~TRINITY_DN14089_c0_g1_i1.p1  ORF type:complete len:158 (-),score=12.26 TRINITY_DN14089_c0_g1_i1:30-503(-)